MRRAKRQVVKLQDEQKSETIAETDKAAIPCKRTTRSGAAKAEDHQHQSSNAVDDKRLLRKRKTKVEYSEENFPDEAQLFDCCFIKVTGKVYEKWKSLKDKLELSLDEDLVLHLLNHYKVDQEKK